MEFQPPEPARHSGDNSHSLALYTSNGKNAIQQLKAMPLKPVWNDGKVPLISRKCACITKSGKLHNNYNQVTILPHVHVHVFGAAYTCTEHVTLH